MEKANSAPCAPSVSVWVTWARSVRAGAWSQAGRPALFLDPRCLRLSQNFRGGGGGGYLKGMGGAELSE